MADEEKPPSENNDEKKAPPADPVTVRDNIGRDPVFYYSRERRLDRASPIVRELNEGKSVRIGLSKRLFGTRGNSFLFFAIILSLAALGLANRFSARERGTKFGGNTLAVAIVKEDEVPILGIVKNAPKSGEAYTGAVDIAVSPVMAKPKAGEVQEVPPVFTHRIFFNPLETETYQVVLPFDGTSFFVLLRSDEEQKSLKITAQGKKP